MGDFYELTLEELLNRVYGHNGWSIIKTVEATRHVHPNEVNIRPGPRYDELVRVEIKNEMA